jgi:ubiquitin conjugation factor E4 B
MGYFSDPEKRSRDDIDSSNASLRGTLKSLQVRRGSILRDLLIELLLVLALPNIQHPSSSISRVKGGGSRIFCSSCLVECQASGDAGAYLRICSVVSVADDSQVEPETVATDSFMVNLQSILLRFAEPFMDANYTKVILPAAPDSLLTLSI